MNRLVLAIVASLVLAPQAARATEAFLVNRAQDLRFVPLRETFTQIRSRVEGHVDLMDRLRRQAFKQLSNDWGIPPADKKDVSIGCVARTDAAGNLSYAIVLRGDIEPDKVKKKLLALNASAAKKRGVAVDQKDVTVQGKAGTRWPYLERGMEFTVVPLERMIVLSAAPKGDQALLEETLTALASPDQLGKGELPTVVVEGKMKLSDAERARVTEFKKKQVAGAVGKIRERFRQLHDTLRPGGAKEDDLKGLDEQLNEQFLKASEYQLKVSWQPGKLGTPQTPGDIYRGKYILRFGSEDDATRMKELILEKSLFFRENAQNQGIPRALDTVTVNAQGPEVTVRVELDTPEKRYDAAFSYVAFLLSFTGADRDLGITRGN